MIMYSVASISCVRLIWPRNWAFRIYLFPFFYLAPVYRLIPIFNQFYMAALLVCVIFKLPVYSCQSNLAQIFKIIIPYIILAVTFSVLNDALNLPPFSLLLVALTIIDGDYFSTYIFHCQTFFWPKNYFISLFRNDLTSLKYKIQGLGWKLANP